MSKGNIIITGASGFIGSNLSRHYLSEGYKVIGVDNFSTGLQENVENLKKNSLFHFIEADVSLEKDWVPKALDVGKSKAVYVFHFASPASPPHYQRLSLETIRVNTIGLENCLRFADICKARVIFASTSEVYGDPLVHPQPESYWGNVNSFGKRSCYDEAKRLGESIIYSWNERHKTQHGLVRIFNTYGPGMNPNDGRVIVNLLQQAMSDRGVLTVYGDGLQTRSFCFITDLISGISRYADSKIQEPINLGNSKEFSILDLVEVLKGLFPQNNLKVEFLPLPADDPQKRRPDTAKAKQLLDWSAKVSLQEGLLQYSRSLAKS